MDTDVAVAAALSVDVPVMGRPPRGVRRRAQPPRLGTLEVHLQSVGRGDLAAFEDVYERTASRVYGLALRVLRDTQLAEEVTQEVFEQVWHTASRFDPGRGAAVTWLMTITHRRAVDCVRRTEAWRRRNAMDVDRSRTAPYDQTSVAAHASLDAQSVRAAVALLSPIQREALELTYFGGYNYREAAVLLQIPVGTAKTRVRDALIRLRVHMAPVSGAAA